MKRKEGELFEAYKNRRAKAQRALKIYLKGRLWWDPKILGTYRRKK